MLVGRFCRSMVLMILGLSAGSPAQEVLCRNGTGSFQAEVSSVIVRAGASRNGELAARSCEASISSNKQNVLVATGVPEVDVEAVGIDLGVGAPVAAFQVKASESDCCMSYRIYSLRKPPRLLYTITGATSFRSQDTDLDGQIEIWADDAAVFSGFDGLTLAEFDSPPRIVLRYSRSQLWDVTAEFQSYFDGEIARLKAALTPDNLRDFKSTDGRLSSDVRLPAERMHRLRRVKVQVLEVVCSYLYSGREQQAWSSLVEMWPSSDVDRIRGLILNARTHGISQQTVGTISPQAGRKKQQPTFDATNELLPGKSDLIPPQAIMITRPADPEPGQNPARSLPLLKLVVDCAGKVRSAEAAGNASVDPALIQATADWKFIPALKEGKAVASRIRIEVGPMQ